MIHSESTIMLVEDSASQATRLIAILEYAGWQVKWASTPEEAFDYLRDHTPALVLLDYYLPGMQGDEICRRIRRNIDSRNLAIVMFTSEQGREVHGLDSGADDFICKSVDPEVLVMKLRALIQRREQEPKILNRRGSSDNFRSARILAVDDSATFLARLQPELENEGYELVTTRDPFECLSLLQTDQFDAAIIDLVMPVMNGIEVCKSVNEIRKKRDLSLVTLMLTSAETTENLSSALEAGADDFVGKSNDFSVLKGRIRALLRRKFFAEENRRILQELRLKEIEATRERVAKEAAQARAALVEKLETSTAELNRSREELKRANEAKDHFMAVLSHELRTPLTPILALLTQRCKDESIPADLLEELQLIKRNVELEARLIDDLLDLTRITKGKMEIRDDEVNLNEVVTHALSMCKTGENHAALHYEHEDQDLIVRGDALRLTQVVWNLLRNAIKFTPIDGKIIVRTSVKPGAVSQALIEIIDTGMGMDRTVLERIFDAFEQGSRQTTRQFGGLGLGLAISKRIVDLHQGHIRASSDGPNRGSTFRVSLPLCENIEIADLVLPTFFDESHATDSGAIPVPPPMILLLEDHQDTRTVMSRLLRMRGHEVITAASVSEAIEIAKTTPQIGMMISDLGLPDGTGFDAVRAVKQHLQIPTIALSGFGMENDIHRSLEAGFSVHLTKPINFESLETEIERLSQEYATQV